MQPSASALNIVFSDSGPGVAEDVRDRIFDPYFSTKPEGVGLGLTIAGETAAEYNGSLELVAGGPLPGATFRISLKNRAGSEDGEVIPRRTRNQRCPSPANTSRCRRGTSC